MGLSSKQVSSDHLEFNWPQNLLTTNTIQQTSNQRSTPMKRSLQTQPPDPLNCPRCDSTNTKFCYYNNYNKTQPRHYCKACKRHWTKGGTLRNVPVGGGRKNKKIKRSTTTTTNTATATSATPATVDHGNDRKYIFPDDKGLCFKPNDREFDQVSWDDFNMHQNLGFSVHSNLTFVDTITNPNPITSSSFSPLFNNSATVFQPWMQVINPTTSSFLEPNNYWSWNENDPMVSKPFSDDPQMK